MKRGLKLISLVVTVLCMIFLISCKQQFTDEEIISAAAELVTEAEEINEIFFGSGIPYSSEGEGAYKVADKEWLAEKGIENTQSLREMTSKVYSEGYSEYLFSIMLASVRTDISVASYASYIDTEEGLLVYSQRTNYIKGKLTYHTDKIEVVEKNGEYARVSVAVTVENSEGETQERIKSFDMVKSGERWFLDSGTFLTYNKNGEDSSKTSE